MVAQNKVNCQVLYRIALIFTQMWPLLVIFQYLLWASYFETISKLYFELQICFYRTLWVSLPSSLWFFQQCILQKHGQTVLLLCPLLLLLLEVMSFLKTYWNSSSRSEDIKIFFFNINYLHQFFGFFVMCLLQRN